MGLGERLRQRASSATPAAASALAPESAPEVFHDLKTELHRRIIDKLDLQAFERLPPERRRDELRAVLSGEIGRSELPLNQLERERMVGELLDELTGLGPLEPLLADSTISDILVNTYSTVYVERRGKLELTQVRFGSNGHLQQIINRIVAQVGRRVDETSPMVDARLADGSRVNAIIPPLAIDGPILSIRRFGVSPLKIRDLVANNALTPEAVGFLGACVKAKLNVLISGGTGAGKTTLLNALSSFIPDSERIVTIEDSAELQLQQRHVVRLETRPPNIEGRGEILARDLVKNALRMRPDRIVVGEVRGGEVLDMLQAMNTGHEGSMTTVHANTPRDALSRIEAMIGMSGVPLSEGATRATISRALNIIAQLNRGTDGRRRIMSIAEITGTEGAAITMQEIYRFEQSGVDATGKVIGEFIPTGIRARAMTRIAQFGVDPAAIAAHVLEER
ncbi:CpaF family protein [Anaeromyxobacter terrae]|uniref:CpaF family protein n=1 Tax=Anaeromyxobacter terrae TaxID=2925406 RepID=UPI001F55BE08|nr:CpaF family protein [Anaeromyxobacter sp. SG22]